jgi:hypothetical protein
VIEGAHLQSRVSPPLVGRVVLLLRPFFLFMAPLFLLRHPPVVYLAAELVVLKGTYGTRSLSW